MLNTAWPYQTVSGLSTLWICLRYISFFTNLFCILKSPHARCVADNILSIIRMHRVLPVLSFFHFPFSPFFFLSHKNSSKLVFLWQLWAKMNEWKSFSGGVKNSSPISPSSTRHKRMSLWNLVPEGCIIGQKSRGPVCVHECSRGWSRLDWNEALDLWWIQLAAFCHVFQSDFCFSGFVVFIVRFANLHHGVCPKCIPAHL